MLLSPWSWPCKCGPAPRAAAGTSALVCRLASPRAGLGRSPPAGSLRYTALGTPAPVTPRHPELRYRPLPGSASLQPPSQAVPGLGPKGTATSHEASHSISVLFHPHDLELQQEESCSLIVFSVIPELKNPLGSLLEQEDTQFLWTHPLQPTWCLRILACPLFTIFVPSPLPKPPPPAGPGNASPLTCALMWG